MAFQKEIFPDKIEVLSTGDLQVREIHRIVDDTTGEVAAQKYHRRFVDIADNIAAEADPRVKAIGQAVRALSNRPKPPAP